MGRVPESEEYLEYLDEDREPRTLDDGFLREPISVLHPPKPVCAARDATIADVVRLMQRHHFGCILVVEGEKLVGILTERDIVQEVFGSTIDPETTRVDRVMTENPETLRPADPIVFALNKMSLGGFRHVPRADAAGSPVGVISVKDIVDHIADFFAQDVQTGPPEPGGDVGKDRDGA